MMIKKILYIGFQYEYGIKNDGDGLNKKAWHDTFKALDYEVESIYFEDYEHSELQNVIINKAKEEMLVAKKEEIVTLLCDEILKRYFYREGMYKYHLNHSPEIIEAVSVLKNESRYQKILK